MEEEGTNEKSKIWKKEKEYKERISEKEKSNKRKLIELSNSNRKYKKKKTKKK